MLARQQHIGRAALAPVTAPQRLEPSEAATYAVMGDGRNETGTFKPHHFEAEQGEPVGESMWTERASQPGQRTPGRAKQARQPPQAPGIEAHDEQVPFRDQDTGRFSQYRMRTGRTVQAVVEKYQINAVLGEGQLLRASPQGRHARRLMQAGIDHHTVADATTGEQVIRDDMADLQGVVAEQLGKDTGHQALFLSQQIASEAPGEPLPDVGLQVVQRFTAEYPGQLHGLAPSGNQMGGAAGGHSIQARLRPALPPVQTGPYRMPIELVPLPALQDNYIWCLAREGQALVVDPGDAGVVEDWLAERHLQLAVILVTHRHADHIGGLARLRARFQPVVYGPEEGISGIDFVARDGEVLQPGPFGPVQVLAVPGHTEGHVAYYLPAESLLFCGDTLFSAGCGRLLGGTAPQLHASLERLSSLPDTTLICCAHEYTLANLRFAAAIEPANPACRQREQEVLELRRRHQPSLPVSLGREKTYNPFLRCREAAVVARASELSGLPLSPGAETFTALRRLKDHF